MRRPLWGVVLGLVTLLAGLGSPGAAQLSELVTRPLPGARADVVALILSAGDGGSLWATALARPDGETGVDFWVEIDGSRLAGEAGAGEERAGEAGAGEEGAGEEGARTKAPRSLRLELHAYAMTGSGEIAGSVSRWVRVPVDRLRDNLLERGVKLAGRLEVEPGEYQLRVLVRETASQRFALRVISVTVPAPAGAAASGPVLLPPRFEDVEGAWIVARDRGAAVPGAGMPAAFPVLSSDREQAMWLEGRGLEGLSLTGRLLDARREAAGELTLTVGPPVRGGSFETAEARFTLPELAAGTYVLELSPGSGGDSAVSLPVFVLGPGWEEPDLTWTTVRRLLIDPERTRKTLELADERRFAKRVDTIAGAYRGVLERLAAGATDEAVDDLTELEAEVLGSTDAGRVKSSGWLAAGEEQVIRDIAASGPDGLVPLLLLHVEAHDRYLSEQADYLLLASTRNRVVTLARSYAEDRESDLAPALAASALADLGVAIDRAGLPRTARKMLEEALAFDPSNTAVLLYLAYWHERRNHYEDAAALLKRLVTVAPRSEEARLRLALCLGRIGEAGEAEQLLRELVRESLARWILSVAYGELGRLLLGQERFQEAVRVLEEAVERLPTFQRLYVQLAYALDRSGQSRLGRHAIDRIPADTGRVTPRMLYSQRPDSQNLSSRAALLRHTTARLSLLSRALARLRDAGSASKSGRHKP